MRKLARDCVYQLIFAYLFSGSWDELLKTTLYHDVKLNESGVAFADQLLTSLKLHIETIKEEVSALAVGFAKERIFKTDLAALILAAVEMKYVGGIPTAVTIDEAVGLCRKYSAENSPAFVNGILATYAKGFAQ